MFFSIEKLGKRIAELESFRYIQRLPIPGLKTKEVLFKSEKEPPEFDDSWKDLQLGSFFEGRDRYLWVQGDFLLPENPPGSELVLLFDFGKTGAGHNSGFESLLFIDGKPFQGVDSNHREVFLPNTYSKKTIRLSLLLWTGLEGGGKKIVQRHELKYADYAFLSHKTDDLYYTANTMHKTVRLLGENSPERHELLNLLEKAFTKIDWSCPGSEMFYETIALANAVLQTGLCSMQKNNPVKITAVGHTHIDVAWLWTLKHTREKLVRSFSTVLRLMERYPEYVFLQSQPQLYAYIKADCPEIYEKIKDKIAEGSWEAGGAMWVEADCNISSGESLVRQILYGKNFNKKEFGKNVKYLWLPDVFGYSWALPQILKKSGIDTFMTTKISWNQYNRMPHDTFMWRGIDGSEVLTHFITTPAGDDEYASHTYNGVISPHNVRGIYNAYRNKDFNRELLLSYGYGDGGGGVNRDMLENIRRCDKMPGLPHIENGRADEFFNRLHETVQKTDSYVHTWDGELYLEYHRGTYTSQAFVKKYNRRLELSLREIEMLFAMGSLTREKLAQEGVYNGDSNCNENPAKIKHNFLEYPTEEIGKAWEIVMRNQFHDIIPGSSIQEVYEDAKAEYEEAFEICERLKSSLIESFQSENNLMDEIGSASGSRQKTEPESVDALLENAQNKWFCFNSAGWDVDQTFVFIPETKRGYFCDELGNTLDSIFRHTRSETEQHGHIVLLTDIPHLGSKTINFVESPDSNEQTPTATCLQNGIETNYYKIHWNDSGQLVEIFDKTHERQVLDGLGNCLALHEDKPINFDAWDIDLFYTLKSEKLAAKSIEVTQNNKLYTKVRFAYSFGKSELVQEMVLYKNSPRIDFHTTVDWHERQRLLRANFEVNIRNTEAVYDIQFGNVKRPTHWNTSWDMAKFETVAHQWVDFAERDYGVALLNDCKYGHSVKDSTIGISLLKGAIYPDLQADIGFHEFTYSLLPHEGDFVTGKVVEEAWKLNNPITPFKAKNFLPNLLKIESKHPVMIDAIKKREDSDAIIVRIHDHTGSKRHVKITPNFEFSYWQEADLTENPLGEKNRKKTIDANLKPYEIITFILRV